MKRKKYGREREKKERIGEVKREKGGREKIYFKWKRREIEIISFFYYFGVTVKCQK